MADAAQRSAGTDFLYRQVMETVLGSVEDGTLQPGDRLPSLRRMSQMAGVSVPTVQQAYVELERLRRVESRPRSGYFVRHAAEAPVVRQASLRRRRPTEYVSKPLVQRVFDGIDRHELVPLGIVSPSRARPASGALGRATRRVMSRLGDAALEYAPTLGEPSLRRQIAHHTFDTLGAHLDPDDVVITNGAQEALLLALSSVACAGDVIAVETPTYHGLLELIDSLGMLALEVETCPEEGIDLDCLAEGLADHPVKACLFSTTLSNPLGATMPKPRQLDLLEMLARCDVPLIEDDVYGELLFDGSRPTPCQFLGSEARILTCSSFSKTAAPGFRIGWVSAPGHAAEIARRKRAFSCTSPRLNQLALADFQASGDYGRHLAALRPVLRRNAERCSALVEEHFPEGTRLSRPVGGSVLWVQLPGRTSAEELFERALQEGVSVAPGSIFSPARRFANCLRLSFGHPWSGAIERALALLGRCAAELAT
ncbi:MAG: PLP-dependent aminotransferase family protein [Acidobacteriota bacterium]